MTKASLSTQSVNAGDSKRNEDSLTNVWRNKSKNDVWNNDKCKFRNRFI